eukprot:GFUD01032628.1.p1 GENE.GFUD01032628.1~~GFUD01032628.1.p1  ORF type:complete len:756 (+),score=148.53 GFUD01032628.1:340-2607(+)
MDSYSVLVNLFFAVCFGSLIGTFGWEIRVKINHRAKKILLSKTQTFQNTNLVVNLVQMLVSFILISTLKMSKTSIFPGQDYSLLCICCVSMKILQLRKETFLQDTIGLMSLLMTMNLLILNSTGSILQSSSMFLNWLLFFLPFPVIATAFVSFSGAILEIILFFSPFSVISSLSAVFLMISLKKLRVIILFLMVVLMTGKVFIHLQLKQNLELKNSTDKFESMIISTINEYETESNNLELNNSEDKFESMIISTINDYDTENNNFELNNSENKFESMNISTINEYDAESNNLELNNSEKFESMIISTKYDYDTESNNLDMNNSEDKLESMINSTINAYDTESNNLELNYSKNKFESMIISTINEYETENNNIELNNSEDKLESMELNDSEDKFESVIISTINEYDTDDFICLINNVDLNRTCVAKTAAEKLSSVFNQTKTKFNQMSRTNNEGLQSSIILGEKLNRDVHQEIANSTFSLKSVNVCLKSKINAFYYCDGNAEVNLHVPVDPQYLNHDELNCDENDDVKEITDDVKNLKEVTVTEKSKNPTKVTIHDSTIPGDIKPSDNYENLKGVTVTDDLFPSDNIKVTVADELSSGDNGPENSIKLSSPHHSKLERNDNKECQEESNPHSNDYFIFSSEFDSDGHCSVEALDLSDSNFLLKNFVQLNHFFHNIFSSFPSYLPFKLKKISLLGFSHLCLILPGSEVSLINLGLAEEIGANSSKGKKCNCEGNSKETIMHRLSIVFMDVKKLVLSMF